MLWISAFSLNFFNHSSFQGFFLYGKRDLERRVLRSGGPRFGTFSNWLLVFIIEFQVILISYWHFCLHHFVFYVYLRLNVHRTLGVTRFIITNGISPSSTLQLAPASSFCLLCDIRKINGYCCLFSCPNLYCDNFFCKKVSNIKLDIFAFMPFCLYLRYVPLIVQSISFKNLTTVHLSRWSIGALSLSFVT